MSETVGDYAYRTWVAFVRLVAVAAFLGTAAVLAWQCYAWLRYGHWIELSVASALMHLGICSDACAAWLARGGDWAGVRKLLWWAPASGLLFIAGLITAAAASVMQDGVRAAMTPVERLAVGTGGRSGGQK